MANSDTVTYRAVVTMTKTRQTHPDSWYDDRYNMYLAHYPNDPQYAQYERDRQHKDKSEVGMTKQFNYGDHTTPSTVKAQITRDSHSKTAWTIDKVEWFISETTWKPVDV